VLGIRRRQLWERDAEAGEQAHDARERRVRLAALYCADGVGMHGAALGERCLRKAEGDAVLADGSAEGYLLCRTGVLVAPPGRFSLPMDLLVVMVLLLVILWITRR
jgi:hypothetical protein